MEVEDIWESSPLTFYEGPPPAEQVSLYRFSIDNCSLNPSSGFVHTFNHFSENLLCPSSSEGGDIIFGNVFIADFQPLSALYCHISSLVSSHRLHICIRILNNFQQLFLFLFQPFLFGNIFLYRQKLMSSPSSFTMGDIIVYSQ